MKVFLTTAYEGRREAPLQAARKLAQQDRHGIHTVIDNAEDADLILFVENAHREDNFYSELRDHPYIKKYTTKTLMYNQQDKPFYVIPGIYTAANKRNSDAVRQQPTVYLMDVNEYVGHQSFNHIEPDILYSFVGAKTALVRNKIFSIDHPNGYVKDTSDVSVFRFDLSTPEIIKERKQDYAKLLMSSKFVLCPRGKGTSSYRLFETMSVGRVPVILSDHWMAPPGPNWEDFAIFVDEGDVVNIDQILTELEPTWQERGNLARQAWDKYFAPDVRFHYIIEQCKDILEVSKGDPDFFKQSISLQEIYIRTRKSKIGVALANIVKPIIVKLHQIKP